MHASVDTHGRTHNSQHNSHVLSNNCIFFSAQSIMRHNKQAVLVSLTHSLSHSPSLALCLTHTHKQYARIFSRACKLVCLCKYIFVNNHCSHYVALIFLYSLFICIHHCFKHTRGDLPTHYFIHYWLSTFQHFILLRHSGREKYLLHRH